MPRRNFTWQCAQPSWPAGRAPWSGSERPQSCAVKRALAVDDRPRESVRDVGTEVGRRTPVGLRRARALQRRAALSVSLKLVGVLLINKSGTAEV